MGFAKRMWEEEQSRQYYTSEDTVCAECFHDRGIKAFINNHLSADNCSICGRDSKEPIGAGADDVLQFILDAVYEHFEPADGNAPYDQEEGRYFGQTWDTYDLIFDELSSIADQEALEWLQGKLKDDVYCRRNWQVLTPGEALKSAWQRFCEAIKHETRFLFFKSEKIESEPFHVSPGEILDQLGEAIRNCGLIRELKAGDRFFRVRGHSAGTTYTAAVDLGPPPQEHAKSAGRMNAPGIPVLYASYDRETAMQEVGKLYAGLSVAEFELLQNLHVVDLTNIPRVPSIFETGPRESLQFLRRFAKDVSQPITPDAEIHIEYTPTQVIAEYFRHRLRDARGNAIRGILYRSAVGTDRPNLALFMESYEVEGVPTHSWKSKKPMLRLVTVTEELPSQAIPSLAPV